MLRGLKHTLCASGPRDPTETETNYVWESPEEVWVSSGLLQGLWVQQTWIRHKSSWRRSPLTPPLGHQNLHRTGETDSWRAQTKSCTHQDPGERSSDPKIDRPRHAHETPGVSCGVVGWQWPTAVSEATRIAMRAWGLLKEVTIIFITSTIAWSQVKQQGETQPRPATENWIKDLLSWPCPSEQDPLSHSVSLSHQEASISLLSLSIRGQTEMKTIVTEN